MSRTDWGLIADLTGLVLLILMFGIIFGIMSWKFWSFSTTGGG